MSDDDAAAAWARFLPALIKLGFAIAKLLSSPAFKVLSKIIRR